jgi:hypothetical protein
MSGHNHPRRPARRRGHWHWGYHRSLQIFPIKEGKQAVMMRRLSCGAMRKCWPILTTVISSAPSYFSSSEIRGINFPWLDITSKASCRPRRDSM